MRTSSKKQNLDDGTTYQERINKLINDKNEGQGLFNPTFLKLVPSFIGKKLLNTNKVFDLKSKHPVFQFLTDFLNGLDDYDVFDADLGSYSGEFYPNENMVALNIKTLKDKPIDFVKTVTDEFQHAKQKIKYEKIKEIPRKDRTEEEWQFIKDYDETVSANNHLKQIYNKQKKIIHNIYKSLNDIKGFKNKSVYLKNLDIKSKNALNEYKDAFRIYYDSPMEIDARKVENHYGRKYEEHIRRNGMGRGNLELPKRPTRKIYNEKRFGDANRRHASIGKFDGRTRREGINQSQQEEYKKQLKERYGKKAFWDIQGKRLDAYMKPFNRIVLGLSPRWIVGNAVSNSVMMSQLFDNPVQFIKAHLDAFKVSDSDMPTGVIDNTLLGASRQKSTRLFVTGNETVDSCTSALLGMAEIDNSNLKTIKDKTITEVSNKTGIPARVLINVSGKLMEFNMKLEGHQRKAAYMRLVDTIGKDLIKETGQNIVRQSEMLKYINKNPKIKEQLGKAVLDTLGDYQKMTNLERNIVKRIAPYHKWIMF